MNKSKKGKPVRGYKYDATEPFRHLETQAQRFRAAVLAHYGNKCACCGETIQEFLSIDHIDNNGMQHRLDNGYGGGMSMYRWILANDFPDCFQILCRNCNWGKHVNNGVCPHEELGRRLDDSG